MRLEALFRSLIYYIIGKLWEFGQKWHVILFGRAGAVQPVWEWLVEDCRIIFGETCGKDGKVDETPDAFKNINLNQ